MNKVIITLISIVVIIGAIFTAIAIVNSDNDGQSKEEVMIAEEEILDDCTDEYEAIKQGTIITNSEQEKTSPNCALITKVYFKECKHTSSQYSNLPEELVNLTKEEIQEKYPDYTIESFANNEIVLYQEKDGECGEHYLVKDNEGMVTIYRVLKDETLEEQERTQISTEYLPEVDKINMQNGIRINGKQNLNQLIEDFE